MTERERTFTVSVTWTEDSIGKVRLDFGLANGKVKFRIFRTQCVQCLRDRIYGSDYRPITGLAPTALDDSQSGAFLDHGMQWWREKQHDCRDSHCCAFLTAEAFLGSGKYNKG